MSCENVELVERLYGGAAWIDEQALLASPEPIAAAWAPEIEWLEDPQRERVSGAVREWARGLTLETSGLVE